MTNKKKTQKHLINEHLKSGKSISPKEAFDLYLCFNLAAVIYDLANEDGAKVSIDTTGEWTVYSLAK